MVNQLVYKVLVEVAGARRTISFAELGRMANMTIGGDGNDAMILDMVLETICVNEVTDGRPLLPVVVVHPEHDMPGARFFKYAKQRNLQTADDRTFFASELKRVHDYWSEGE